MISKMLLALRVILIAKVFSARFNNLFGYERSQDIMDEKPKYRAQSNQKPAEHVWIAPKFITL